MMKEQEKYKSVNNKQLVKSINERMEVDGHAKE